MNDDYDPVPLKVAGMLKCLSPERYSELLAAEAEVERLRAALLEITMIPDKQYGLDWEEIEEARSIANAALAEK
jgi:hypothetical protein